MNGEAPRVVHQRTLASPWTRAETHPPDASITSTGADKVAGVRQVVEAVGRCISFDAAELPEEFFPTHLSVAIIETVFRFQPEPEESSSQITQRYCRQFGLTHRRRNMFELPPTEEQETLADLIAHFAEWGVEGMAKEVFKTSYHVPGTTMCRADTVLQMARALRDIGIDVLQDVQDRPAQELEETLCSVPGTDRSMARMLLTYAGDDDFVLGDDPVRRFVAEAIGNRTVSASWAAHLVCQAAYEIVLSPRHLDYRIYRYRAGR